MPKDKTETHERIIPAAMKIFLEKGFEKATMREIAEEAGITAAGLYRHFVDKEAMFAALVEPVLSELQKWCERTRQVDYDFLEQGDLDAAGRVAENLAETEGLSRLSSGVTAAPEGEGAGR